MRRPEIDQGLLLGMLVVLALAWAFVLIADEVAEGDTKSLDDRILLLFRRAGDPDTPIGPGWVAKTARDVTSLGSTPILILVTAGAAGFLGLSGRRRTMWFLIAAVVSGALVSGGLKSFFDRPRPDVVSHLDLPTSSSFPSGHSFVSAVVYLTLGALLARVHEGRALKAYFLALAALLSLLVGVSRVFLGVHFPTDVLAGWSAGVAWALACVLAARALERRR